MSSLPLFREGVERKSHRFLSSMRSIVAWAASAAVVSIFLLVAVSTYNRQQHTDLLDWTKDDPRDKQWFRRYMARPESGSYYSYAMRANWLPPGWRVEWRQGSPFRQSHLYFVNMINNTYTSVPPVKPPPYLTGEAYIHNGIPMTFAPTRDDWGVGLAPAGTSARTRAAYWAYTHPAAKWHHVNDVAWQSTVEDAAKHATPQQIEAFKQSAESAERMLDESEKALLTR